MADGKGGIPTWQRKERKEGTEDSLTPNADSTPESHPAPESPLSQSSNDEQVDKPTPNLPKQPLSHPDQAPLVERAAKFLQDPQVRDASPEGKRRFLRSRGLSEDSIKKNAHLLPNTTHTSTEPLQPRQVSPPSSETAHRTSFSRPAETPPVITYPEHLLQPQKPPPLVTTTRLLNIAYAFAGLTATFYGLSNYLVRPMTESLSVARHDFHAHTGSKLDELNKRLEGTVSVDPAHGTLISREEKSSGASGAIDTASEDSDPTELFHRDFGTQTSPDDLPKRPASQSSSDSNIQANPAEAHQRKLNRIKTIASDLSSDSINAETQTVHELRVTTEMLREQLEGLAFPASADGGSFGLGANGAGFSNLYGTGVKKEPDEASRVKQEIRSLKGSLLSARSFPAGAGASSARREWYSPSTGGQVG